MENSDQATLLTKRERDLLNYWKTLSKDASTKQQIERWEKLFQNKETRYGYVDGFLDSFLGMQIRVLREQKGWNQTELAERTGMKQPRIHLLESMNYSAWSVNVLRRLAKAFDLRLVVKFEDFGSFVPEYFDDFDRENLKRRSFKDDVIFNSEERNKSVKLLASQKTSQTSQPSNVITGRTRSKKTRKFRGSFTKQLSLPFETLQDIDIKTGYSRFVEEIENTRYQVLEQFDDTSNKTEPKYNMPVQNLTGAYAF